MGRMGDSMGICKVGILGTGIIAGVMARTLNEMADAQGYAVASRNEQKALAFAKENGVDRAYGSYEALLNDANVDLVYIATPHGHHAQHMKMCIEHSKPILCEKAFTLNAAQAENVLSLAKEKNVFVAEAFWTRYQPFTKQLCALVQNGIVGTVRGFSASLCFPLSHIERLHNQELGGGALLDLGVYPLNFAFMVLGHTIDSYTSSATFFDTGVDSQNCITLQYSNGVLASLRSSALSVGDQSVTIYGEEGYLHINHTTNPTKALLYDKDMMLKQEYAAPLQISGYEYEVRAAAAALANGALECEEASHEDTLQMMRFIDRLHCDWKMPYPHLK